jgi:hypothetical protein
MDECLAELTTAINRAAADGLQAPAGRLRTGSQGYLEYSRTVCARIFDRGLTCAIVGRPVSARWRGGASPRSRAGVRYEPADRAWFAALAGLSPRSRWTQIFPVTPAMLVCGAAAGGGERVLGLPADPRRACRTGHHGRAVHIVDAWVLRNCRHVVWLRCGAGGPESIALSPVSGTT